MASALRVIRAPAIPGPPSSEGAGEGHGWEVWIAFGAVVAAAIMALTAPASGERALAKLPPAERAALFSRTRANVASLCTGEAVFRDVCREEVQILRLFPECDQACQAAARAAWPGPTR